MTDTAPKGTADLQVGEATEDHWDEALGVIDLSDGLYGPLPTEVSDLLWEVEQVTQLSVSSLDDWLDDWADDEDGLPYAGRVQELRDNLARLGDEVRDLADTVDTDRKDQGNMPYDDYDQANEAINQDLRAEDLLSDADLAAIEQDEVNRNLLDGERDPWVDQGGPSLKKGSITLEDLFGPTHREQNEADLTNLFAQGGINADSISLEGAEPTDED